MKLKYVAPYVYFLHMPNHLPGTKLFCCAGNRPAYANIVQDLAKGFVRPDLAFEEAAVVMMDARGTLYELKVIKAPVANLKCAAQGNLLTQPQLLLDMEPWHIQFDIPQKDHSANSCFQTGPLNSFDWPGRTWHGHQRTARKGSRRGDCSREWQNGCVR